MRRLHLIRHGRTRANAEMLYCGSTDLPLLPEGREALISDRDSACYPAPGEDCAVYTSGMKRTEETLAILYGEVPHEILTGLREIDFGDFEMHSYDELKNWESYQQWLSGDNESNCCPNGESGQQMQKRVLETLDALQKQGKDALVVTHGGVIAAIMARLFPKTERSRFAWQPAPGRGFTVLFEQGSAVSFQEIPVFPLPDNERESPAI